MASNTISILIKAQDNASKVIRDVGENIDGTGKKAAASGKSVGTLNDHMGALAGVTASAGVATWGLVGMMDKSISSANTLQASLTGLNSVARAFGQDAGKAEAAAQALARDGLMTVADAATGLKNLLSSGFSLDEAVTLMGRFKDSAAFGRQSALSFGQAVASATEGIKNGNSILVDNAGVTKNLSNMLTDAGYSAQELSKATSDAGIRQAIFQGILKETNAQSGDAARLAESAAGKQAVWAAQTEILHQRIGMALQPALLELLKVATPVIEVISNWVSKNPELAAGILIGVTALTSLVAVLGIAAVSITTVTTLFGAMSALVAAPIVMPAIAVAAALAALGLVIAKTHETINLVRSLGDAIDRNRRSGEQTDSAIKRAAQEGRISQEKYQEYIRNTGRVSESVVNDMRHRYDGFFGPLNRSFDNLFARLSGAKEQFKGTGFGGFANGTAYAPGGLTLVGENGPELVNLPRGSQVTQAYRTRNELGSSGGPSLTIGTINNYTGTDEKKMLSDIGFALRLAS